LDIKTTIDLLTNPEENMAKMKDMALKLKTQIVEMAQKWEATRAPLVEEYRALKDSHSKREGEIAKKLEELKAIREEINSLKDGTKKKEARLKQLQEILNTIPKEIRTTYTTKILFLVGSVKKQRVEITKILIDMRNVQKDINNTSEKLNRTFTLVEEMIFADAKKDPVGKSTYTLTVQLNKIFNELTDLISKTGLAANASLVLTDKIDKLQTRTTALNMQQMEDDLKQVKDDNAKLQEKIKEASTKKEDKKKT